VTGVATQRRTPRPLLGAAALFACLAVGVALVASAHGAGDLIVVQNTNDAGPGSLRQAIADATPDETIKVPKGRYVLTSGQLLVETRVRIVGAGARETLIDGNHASRVFEFAGAATGSTMTRLAVQNGNAGNADGGGILLSNTALRLVKVAVKNNRVNFNNNASGGGISGTGMNALFLSRSVVSGNHGYNGAGANVSRFDAFASTIARNIAGGSNSNGDAGAVQADQLVLDFSTVSKNRCFNGPGCGGAFFLNRATIRDSIVAGNLAFQPNGKRAGSKGNPGREDNCSAGDYTSKGHNLEGLKDCGFTKPSDLQKTNPLLKRLANYGGQTNTMALRPGSPAVDAGSRCKSTDQRRVKRPQGPRCDIGAFEL
jgi:hypothetical protein